MRTAPALAVMGALVVTVAAVGSTGRALPTPVPKPAVEAPIDPAVERLVKDLGSDDYRTREKAGQQLAARGERALPDLRRALAATADPEVSRRLGVLVRKMDRDRLVSPKRVTADLKNKTAKEAFDEIAKQTGYAIQFQAGTGGEKFSFAFAGAPFWEAVDRVANAAGLVVQTGYDDDTIHVYNGGESVSPFVAYAGPFRFVAQNINSNKSVQLAGINKQTGLVRPQENMNLNFQVFSEPKNPILGVTQAELIAATDDTGASLVPPKGDGNVRQHRSMYYNPGNRGYQAYGGVSLVRGDRSATAIRQLKGKVGVVMLAGVLPEVVVAEPEKVKNQKFVGRTVEIDLASVTEANGHYTVSMTVKKLGASDPNNIDYSWSSNIWQKLELHDAKGNKYRTHGPNNFNQNVNSVQLTVQYGPDDRGGPKPAVKLGPVVKLVFNEWLSVTHEVTFEFKNVPLP